MVCLAKARGLSPSTGGQPVVLLLITLESEHVATRWAELELDSPVHIRVYYLSVLFHRVYGPPNFVSCRDFRNLFFLPGLPSAKKTSCRDCSRDSASCRDCRQEAESCGQSRQLAIYSK